MNPTNIAWCTDTWNPVTGCTPVSIGCKNCYAKRLAETRLRGRCGYPQDDPFRVTVHPERLDEPVKVKKHRRIFVCSMSDLFHKDISDDFIMRIFNVIEKTPQHDYMVLTKRPERMRDYFVYLIDLEFYKNINNLWLGITIENQATWDARKEPLKELSEYFPVFVSAEPLLGPIDMGDISWLDWLIVGGETGPGARFMESDWARYLLRQARRHKVPFFFKQWGGKNKGNILMNEVHRQYPKNMRV